MKDNYKESLSYKTHYSFKTHVNYRNSNQLNIIIKCIKYIKERRNI